LLLPAKQHHQEAANRSGISKTLHEDMHGGEYETSILLSAYPDYVKSEYIKDHSNPERPLLTLLGMSEYTEEGIIGFPSLATKEKGEIYLREIPEVVSADLKRFLSL
ncbi:MAG: creatininase family protein, partial [Candidatus Thiodiazotropha sp.]